MHCYLHEQKEAVGTCVSCGKFICSECATEIKGKNHCKSCVSEAFEDAAKKVENLENKAVQTPMVFMNAGGASSSSSSAASATTAAPVHVHTGGHYVCTKSKVVAGVLGIIFGSVGAHKFYLGHLGLGILFLLFCWTGIPAIIGLIEGIILLTTPDAAFNAKYGYFVN